MRVYDAKANALGSGFFANPSPGNIKDGLVTDAIKSAGAAKKGGTSPIVDVLDYTEQVINSGLNLLCTPGNDVESTTGLVGSGANIILFTTGLGTPTGNPAVPVVKISSNTSLYNKMNDIIDFNTNLKVGPPIRSKSDRKKLIEGIKNGTIDCIATDHAPHTIEDKETTFNDAEFGMIGLESCFGVVNKVLVKDNGMSLKSLIEKLTVNPRKIMNINRDLFSIGEKAQITIFDPNEKWTFSENQTFC